MEFPRRDPPSDVTLPEGKGWPPLASKKAFSFCIVSEARRRRRVISSVSHASLPLTHLGICPTIRDQPTVKPGKFSRPTDTPRGIMMKRGSFAPKSQPKGVTGVKFYKLAALGDHVVSRRIQKRASTIVGHSFCHWEYFDYRRRYSCSLPIHSLPIRSSTFALHQYRVK